MDKNRKILIAILVMLVFSAMLSIISISITIQKKPKVRYSFDIQQGPGIAILHINGTIQAFDNNNLNGAETIVKKIDRLAKDELIKAIILRINSPGGTVAATQEIYNKLLSLRKQNKIIIASLADIATSGAYYIASACNYIIANHGTITGSIGVIALSPNLKGLFNKLGIKMNVIKSGKYKDILASYRDISNEERELIQNIIDSSYKKFLYDVALGRNLAINDIQPYADGRVFSGKQALEYKLIDAIGTFDDAIKKARELAKLPEDSAIYEEQQDLFNKLFSILSKSNYNLNFVNYNNIPIGYIYLP